MGKIKLLFFSFLSLLVLGFELEYLVKENYLKTTTLNMKLERKQLWSKDKNDYLHFNLFRFSCFFCDDSSDSQANIFIKLKWARNCKIRKIRISNALFLVLCFMSFNSICMQFSCGYIYIYNKIKYLTK